MTKVGDWVKTCYAGYWKIVDIKPKYAECDECNEQRQCKKGDQIGWYALIKKGFTPKMKFKVESKNCDINWCVPVSSAERLQIDQYFQDHPKDFEKFNETPFEPKIVYYGAWIQATEEEADQFEKVLSSLPSPYTSADLMKKLEENGLSHCFAKPPANYRYSCTNIPWEMDDKFELLFRNPEIKKVSSN